MLTLIQKEIRELRAVIVLMFALWVFGYLVLPFFERVDELGFYGLCYGACDPGIDVVSGWFGLLLTLATAYCLYPREHDSGTIRFLSTLPVSGLKIFAAKFIAGFGLLCCFELVSLAFSSAIISLNPDSIEGGFYWNLQARYLVMVVVFLFVVLSHGIFLSWFRTFGFIMYAIYVSVVNWMQATYSDVDFLNVFELLRFEYFGQKLVLPLAAMTVHVPLAFGLLVISYFLWNRQRLVVPRQAGAAAQKSGMSASLWRWGKVAMPVFAMCLVTLAIGWRFGMEANVSGTATLKAKPYTWFYRQSDQAAVDKLAQPGLVDYNKLKAFLGTEENPDIIVDATRTSAHFAGTAGWKRIRIDVSGNDDEVFLRRVLSHETVHVFQSTLSEGQLGKFNNSVRFFTEGMAQYLSFQVVPGDDALRLGRALAAMIVSRQGIRIDDLVDDQQFSRRFASEHVYSIGETWTAAMVSACGESILGDLLRYLRSERVSARRFGLTWWRASLQALDCDLGQVETAWKQLLRDAGPDYQQQTGRALLALDFLGFERSQDSGAVFATFDLVNPDARESSAPIEGPGPKTQNDTAVYLLRLKHKIDSELPSITVVRGAKSASGTQISFRIPSEWAGKRFQFQAGVQYSQSVPEYYEAWQSGSTADAR